MNFFKRIGLFLLLNFVVVLTLSVLMNLLGLKPYLTKHGLDPMSLLGFCFVWGMGGAIISLQLSRFMAKSLLGIKILNDHPANPSYQKLVHLTKKLSAKAGLQFIPEIGVWETSELNAFATGPSQRRSLVAVSSGLLNKMTDEELEGVLAHEIAHIKNGDMVTMTLLQGVINAFVMFLARILAYALAMRGKNENSRPSYGSYYMFVFLFEVVFMLAGSMVVAAYSRYREFRADQGGADTAGTAKMIAALERLKNELFYKDPSHATKTKEQPALTYMKISGHKPHGIMRFFASHPPLEERIAKLKARL